MKTQNIIVCSPQLGISPESSSGGEVYDREILSSLAKLGCRIEVFLPKDRKYSKKVKNFRVSFARIRTMFPPYIFNIFALSYLFKIYKKTNFQILRIHSPYFVGPAAVIFKTFNPKVKLVASYLHLEDNNLIFELINRLIIRKFDAVITISTSTKKELIKKYHLNPPKTIVTYPGVSQEFQPLSKNKKLLAKFKLENKFVLLFFAGLKFRKNPGFLIDVLKGIDDQDIVLVFVGSGQAEPFLRMKVKILGLSDRVRFLGYVPEREKVKYYNLADLFLLPSKKEGFGMIVAEAAACGIPAIVSNRSSLPEVVRDEETGFVLPLDSKLWAEKIEFLAQNEQLRQQLGQNARRYVVKNFSWEKTAEKQLDLFRRLIR